MEHGALLAPLLVILILLGFYRERIVWWEIALLLGLSVTTLYVTRFGMEYSDTSDTEFLGSYVVRVEYDEPWNEYIHKTCSRRTKVGKSTITTHYDCSYVRYHSAEWRKIDQHGNSYGIEEGEYQGLLQQLGTARVFVDMHRHYHTQDGDRYLTSWNGENRRMRTITIPHRYENRIQISHSIFHLQPVDSALKRKWHLVDYPAISELDYQPAVIGLSDTTGVHGLDVLNARLGKEKQLRVFLVVFPGAPAGAGYWQQQYWEGGNKNELIITVGTDVHTGKVTWCYPFSWQKRPTVEIKVRDYLQAQPRLDIPRLTQFLYPTITRDWRRRSFADFAYLQFEMSGKQLLVVYVLVCLVSIGIGVYAVLNDQHAEGVDSFPRLRSFR
jgi:hypothetical protein